MATNRNGGLCDEMTLGESTFLSTVAAGMKTPRDVNGA